MSERELNKCKKCHSRHNGNGDICGICQDNTIDLLTLGLLQEKNKVRKLKETLQSLVNNVFAGCTPMPKHMYAYRQATKTLLEFESEQKPLGEEMADAFDKIIEP